MAVTADELRRRTKQLAIGIVRLCRSFPPTPEARIIGNQLLRCGTSVGANYRAVCRARSRADFVSKIGIVVEEADEAVFWLELLVETGVAPASRVTVLIHEANELLAIFGASQLTAKQNVSRQVFNRQS